MAWSGISFVTEKTTYFTLQVGFSGMGMTPPPIFVQSVVLADLLGNINTFAITNASLEDLNGDFDSIPLTFPPNVWTADETVFFFGFDRSAIRINFDISGLTLLGNPFNITEVEAVPMINILP